MGERRNFNPDLAVRNPALRAKLLSEAPEAYGNLLKSCQVPPEDVERNKTLLARRIEDSKLQRRSVREILIVAFQTI